MIALSQWRKPGVVLVLWMLMTSLGNALLLESAVSARYVLAFPAVAILVALGIRVHAGLLALARGAMAGLRARAALLVALIALADGGGAGRVLFRDASRSL